MSSCTRSIGPNYRIWSASCAQADAANIAGAHTGDGRWWDKGWSYWRNGDGRRVRRPTKNILDSGKWTPVVLACAHLNHDPVTARLTSWQRSASAAT